MSASAVTGRPIQILITHGQAHDLTGAKPTLAMTPSLSPTRPTIPIACGLISEGAAPPATKSSEQVLGFGGEWPILLTVAGDIMRASPEENAELLLPLWAAWADRHTFSKRTIRLRRETGWLDSPDNRRGARSRGAHGGPRRWRQFDLFDRLDRPHSQGALSLAARSCSLANNATRHELWGRSAENQFPRSAIHSSARRLTSRLRAYPISRSSGLGFSCDREWVIRKGRAADRFKILCWCEFGDVLSLGALFKVQGCAKFPVFGSAMVAACKI